MESVPRLLHVRPIDDRWQFGHGHGHGHGSPTIPVMNESMLQRQLSLARELQERLVCFGTATATVEKKLPFGGSRVGKQMWPTLTGGAASFGCRGPPIAFQAAGRKRIKAYFLGPHGSVALLPRQLAGMYVNHLDWTSPWHDLADVKPVSRMDQQDIRLENAVRGGIQGHDAPPAGGMFGPDPSGQDFFAMMSMMGFLN